MVHTHYDFNLVLCSIIIAFLTCFFAISIEQLLLRDLHQKYEKIILILTGLVLGTVVWCLHYLGMLASHLPSNHSFDYQFTFIAYAIAFIFSTFAIWLSHKATLSYTHLIFGAILTGLGISGVHYTGMMGLVMEHYKIQYDPFITSFSVFIAMCGSGLTFFLALKYKNALHNQIYIKVLIALAMAFTIMGMHYTGMAAVSFHLVHHVPQWASHDQTGEEIILFSLIFVISLIVFAALSVAILEQRLATRNKQLFKVNRELANQMIQDHLTKLPNHFFLERYSEALFKSRGCSYEKIAFIYLDLDHFKTLNDVFGHPVGDQLLLQLATRITNRLTEKEKFLRIGGDEFLMVLEQATLEQAIEKSEQLLKLIQARFLIDGKELYISSSIGIAMYPDHGRNLHDLLLNADTAMLMSKYQGRNSYSVFHYTIGQQEIKYQASLINDLYKAVEQQQFMLFFQPKFNTIRHDLCGVEALIRWNHPHLGCLTPHHFIHGAEKTGLIIQMGYWVLEQACKQIQIWEKKALNYFPVAVNLSAVQFEHKALCSTLEKLFEKYQINPNHLTIEITESTAMTHVDESIQIFKQLRQMGVKLAIDDFGTGHSSFLYLKNLPVDELKIDRAFIRDLYAGSKDEMILKSIIQLAIQLDLVVTAEGVETPLQVEILTQLGCQQLQGYFLGIPMAVQQLEQAKYTLAK